MPNSPVINVGSNYSGIDAVDQNGNTRIVNLFPDAGAIESPYWPVVHCYANYANGTTKFTKFDKEGKTKYQSRFFEFSNFQIFEFSNF
jgi:hypothetical protein